MVGVGYAVVIIQVAGGARRVQTRKNPIPMTRRTGLRAVCSCERKTGRIVVEDCTLPPLSCVAQCAVGREAGG